MSKLAIHVRFIAHSYSGIRIRENRQEELDWPPSPGRLHEALLSAALLGVHRASSQRDEVFAAFRWLEKLSDISPPEIWAKSQREDDPRFRPRVAIPQNNPKKNKLDTKPSLLAPARKAVSVTGEPLEVCYHWPLVGAAPSKWQLDTLADAAARISYIGRAEDRAQVALTLIDEFESLPLVRWKPDSGGDTELWVAKHGTTAWLEERYTTIVPPRESKRSAQRGMRSVRYSDDAPRTMQPVAAAIFQLFPDNNDPDAVALSCGAETSGRWREFFRFLVIDLAHEEDHWDDPALAAELLTGHSAPNEPATRPHLAIVPLPSINEARTADGRVRRVALLGYAAPQVAAQAVPLYETLFKALNNRVVTEDTPHRRQGKSHPVRLRQIRPAADNIWPQLTAKSRVWCSIIPVAISRGFKVPKFHPDGRELSDNERHRRKLSEWAALLHSSLKHIGLTSEVIAACSIEFTFSPLVPKSQRAEKYRAPGEKAVLTHVRLEFPVQVRGPFILGDRRYFGLGLFVPA